MGDTENTNKSSGLPNKAFKVKNKAPAPIQITAEQIIREAQSRQLDVPTKRKAPKITDEEELAEHYRKKRKEYEDDIRKNRIQLNNWTKYAKFEISIGEIERARNVYERALSQFPTNPTLYLQYAEMECKNKQVNHARNIYDRAVLILPRNSQFWTKYALLEETIGNIPGARTVFERWMETEPDEQAWQTYINFEKRYKEHDKVANIYQRFLHVHGDIEKNWVKYAKYEESAGAIDTARKVFEGAVNYFQEHVSGYLLSEFAKFEERQKEIERVRTICQFALKNLPEEETGEIFNLYTKVEKRHGTISDIENAVFAKRKNIYEKEIEQNGYNYDAWFDYLKLLCQFCQTHDEIIDGFERAISWCPPSYEKRDWKRYIYLWIKYAIYTELVMNDVERTRKIYKKCIELIPHKAFTFAKIWIMFGEFELRHDNLDGYRKIMGRAIGQCPKNKLFDSYIETEIKLQEFDRCRILYTKWLEFSPENPNVWIKYAELETLLDEIDRARSIFDTAVKLPQLDMPEALWKAYIDFEIKQENYSNARMLFERLLKLANNIKIWLTYAEFETSIGKIKNGRKVYERANTALLNGKKEDRITLLKAWRTFEKRYGDTESKNNIKALMPKKIKKRRQIQTADGIDAGWEEYFDYVFAQDQTNKGGFKLLEAAKRWKEKQTEGDKIYTIHCDDLSVFKNKFKQILLKDHMSTSEESLSSLTHSQISSLGEALAKGDLKYLMENLWVVRFLLILLGYSTVIVPCIILVKFVRQKFLTRPDYRGDNILWKALRIFAIGQPEYSLSVGNDSTTKCNKMELREEKEVKNEKKKFIDDCLMLSFYFLGIQSNFIIMGFIQEKIMTQGYSMIGNEGIIEKFGDAQFLVLCNRIVALFFCCAILLGIRRRQAPHVPPFYYHSYISLSNTLSSWCQYEALKFVSFPTQTVCKASKVIPTMIMGRLLRKEKYSKEDYAMAVCLAFGAAVFLLSQNNPTTTSSLTEHSTTISGVILMAGYLSFDAYTLNKQKQLFDTKPKLSKYQMMLGVNLFSAVLCTVSLLEQSTLFSSIEFMISHHTVARDAFLLSFTGSIGQIFIYMTIERFGPIVFAVIMTIRQILSIVLSSLYFNHGLSIIGIIGLIIAFGSILFSTYRRYFSNEQKKKSVTK